MPDSLILIMIAGLAITAAVLWHRDAYQQGHEHGYNRGFATGKNSCRQTHIYEEVSK